MSPERYSKSFNRKQHRPKIIFLPGIFLLWTRLLSIFEFCSSSNSFCSYVQPDWLTEEPLVYVIGLHAVQFVNNWIKKIPKTAKFCCQRNFLSSIISKLDIQECSPLTYCVRRRRTLTIRVPCTK